VPIAPDDFYVKTKADNTCIKKLGKKFQKGWYVKNNLISENWNVAMADPIIYPDNYIKWDIIWQYSLNLGSIITPPANGIQCHFDSFVREGIKVTYQLTIQAGSKTYEIHTFAQNEKVLVPEPVSMIQQYRYINDGYDEDETYGIHTDWLGQTNGSLGESGNYARSPFLKKIRFKVIDN
jgi:hypothetical protein